MYIHRKVTNGCIISLSQFLLSSTKNPSKVTRPQYLIGDFIAATESGSNSILKIYEM